MTRNLVHLGSHAPFGERDWIVQVDAQLDPKVETLFGGVGGRDKARPLFPNQRENGVLSRIDPREGPAGLFVGG